MRKNAETIKEVARQAGVPILRNVPLAQALHKLDLEEEIPEELYEAVAEVLNFVFELKEKEQKAQDARRQQKAPATPGPRPATTPASSASGRPGAVSRPVPGAGPATAGPRGR